MARAGRAQASIGARGHERVVALLASVALFVLWLAPGTAQEERHGMRVHYTSIGANSGLEGRAFVPVPDGKVTLAKSKDPACSDSLELAASGSLPRGPLRSIAIRVSLPSAGGRAALGSAGCAKAHVETTLEDGSVLSGGEGYVELEKPREPSERVRRGAFSQTMLRAGVPVTIDGTFVLGATGAPL